MALLLQGHAPDRHGAANARGDVCEPASMYFPKVYNIEMDPHEDLNLGGITVFMAGPAYEVIKEYDDSVKKYPNPPSANLTHFTGLYD